MPRGDSCWKRLAERLGSDMAQSGRHTIEMTIDEIIRETDTTERNVRTYTFWNNVQRQREYYRTMPNNGARVARLECNQIGEVERVTFARA